MSVCFEYMRLVWVAAFLMMAGGQIAHAGMDFHSTSHESHATHEEHQHADAEQGACTQSHCCHFHSFASLFRVESNDLRHPNLECGKLPITEKCAPDSPVREIEYPPQLS